MCSTNYKTLMELTPGIINLHCFMHRSKAGTSFLLLPYLYNAGHLHNTVSLLPFLLPVTHANDSIHSFILSVHLPRIRLHTNQIPERTQTKRQRGTNQRECECEAEFIGYGTHGRAGWCGEATARPSQRQQEPLQDCRRRRRDRRGRRDDVNPSQPQNYSGLRLIVF
jgi:hypothetical protein